MYRRAEWSVVGNIGYRFDYVSLTSIHRLLDEGSSAERVVCQPYVCRNRHRS